MLMPPPSSLLLSALMMKTTEGREDESTFLLLNPFTAQFYGSYKAEAEMLLCRQGLKTPRRRLACGLVLYCLIAFLC
jgi:hypothetical protein